MRSLKMRMLGVIRYLRPDRNPLRRPVDRAHSRLVLALVSLFLIMSAVATVLTVWLVDGAGLRAERRQARTRYPADAVIVDTNTGTAENGLSKNTRLSWRDSAGNTRGATVPQITGDRVGIHRQVWIDRTGELTVRPRTHVQTITDTTLAALSALTMVAIAHLGAYALGNRRLERRRLELWEGEWAAVAPRWTGRP